jgi:hypothetical protein
VDAFIDAADGRQIAGIKKPEFAYVLAGRAHSNSFVLRTKSCKLKMDCSGFAGWTSFRNFRSKCAVGEYRSRTTRHF